MKSANVHLAVIDDNVQMGNMLRDFLVSQGYKVTLFDSAKSALREIRAQEANSRPRQTSISIVISDIAMPTMTGLDLLKILRAERPDIPMILITAFGSAGQGAEAITLGAAEYLVKPFKLAALERAIKYSAKVRR